MIDHVSLAVADLKASATFYDRVLQPLGLARMVERETTVGFGKKYPEFWLNARPGVAPAPHDSGHHVCLRARSREDVDKVHALLGDMGAQIVSPAQEGGWAPGYYYVLFEDPDGIRLEVNHVPGQGVLAEDAGFDPGKDYR